MCERNDTPGNDSISNLHFARFKKKLEENNFKSECRKCSSPGFVLLHKQDVYCASCLQEYCIQKFRATIGKSRLVKSGNSVLVTVSGGVGSVAMLDMIQYCQQLPDVHKRIRYIPSILHIHEGILNQTEGLKKELFNYFIQSRFPVYFTTLEQLLNPSGIEFFKIDPESDCDSSEDSRYEHAQEFLSQSLIEFGDQFTGMFETLKSFSSKQDFLAKLRLLIITKVANKLGTEKVFIGSTMSELSVDLMNDMSLGKGMEIHSQTNFSDDRFSPVTLLRPMREFSTKEMIFYAKHRQLESFIHKPNLSTITNKPIKSSIYKMTEFFLHTLQNDFPATIHTVFHTGSKLTSIDEHSQDRCAFCYSKVDIQRNDQYSAYDALRLTASLSMGGDSNIDKAVKTGEGDDSAEVGGPKGIKFCYSCLRLSLELGSDRLASLCTSC